MRQLVLNRIQTPDGTILTSYYRHDYVSYVDKNGLEYMVDGGLDYLRRNVHENAPYKELSVYDDNPWEIVRQSFHRGGRGKNGDQPLKWVPMSEMSNGWLENSIQYNLERGIDDSFASSLYRKELEYRKNHNIYIED